MKNNTNIIKSVTLILMTIFILLVNLSVCSAVTLERIVAIVDEKVVLMSEFQEALRLTESAGSELSEEDVINQMINRIILLREAAKFGLKRKSADREGDNVVINEFVNRRIRAFIHIPYAETESYYNERDDFKEKEFIDVKDEIEKLLISNELVKRLHEFVEEHKQKSYIRIQLKE